MNDLTQLGQPTPWPTSPDGARLERVPSPAPGTNYLVRFTAPEFTSLCPITGQPDFAHIVIDYVPGAWLVESKSLKLYLGSFRNHGAFHEACTMQIAGQLVALLAPVWLRIGAYWYPRGGMPIDVFWQTGVAPEGVWVPDQGVAPIAAVAELGPEARIRDQAVALGFDAVGFAPARLGPEARARLVTFLAAGHHGDMGWMAERTELRSDPAALWPAAGTVVALGLSYAPEGDALATLQRPDRGNISVYARHRDYHDVVRGKLKHLAQFIVSRFGGDARVFVDTAPVMEKPLAERAGLGWQGKHTNLVSRAHGSWLFLGEVFTSLVLAPSAPPAGGCGSCTRCLEACPTDAFPAPYRLDATRCISYLTIEHRGRSRMRCARRSAIASMAATTAWRCARGTSSPRPGGRQSSPPGPIWQRPRWPSWRGWTMRGFARGSPARRSSAPAATGSCATC